MGGIDNGVGGLGREQGGLAWANVIGREKIMYRVNLIINEISEGGTGGVRDAHREAEGAGRSLSWTTTVGPPRSGSQRRKAISRWCGGWQATAGRSPSQTKTQAAPLFRSRRRGATSRWCRGWLHRGQSHRQPRAHPAVVGGVAGRRRGRRPDPDRPRKAWASTRPEPTSTTPTTRTTPHSGRRPVTDARCCSGSWRARPGST